jgi:hypothetical protein
MLPPDRSLPFLLASPWNQRLYSSPHLVLPPPVCLPPEPPTTIYGHQKEKNPDTLLLSFVLAVSYFSWQLLHLHTSPSQCQDSVLCKQFITSEEITTSDFGLDPGWRGKQVSETKQFWTFLISTIQISSRERKKSGITKSFRQKNAQINFSHRSGHDWFHGRLSTLRLSWSHHRWILLASAVLCGHLLGLLASAAPEC